jgi:cell division protein FtsA
VSLKNLAYIIEARMSEIMELVYAEIYRMGLHDKLSAGIVLTGGGSQLQNLEQLTEYITGLDTRIGYPNQHLGKSRIEAVKSPMYATTVGLVLSGYHSLDERQTRAPYEQEEPGIPAYYAPQAAPAGPAPAETRTAVPAPPTPAPAPAKPKEPGAASRFFKDIITRTKGLLIDDYDDKSY